MKYRVLRYYEYESPDHCLADATKEEVKDYFNSIHKADWMCHDIFIECAEPEDFMKGN